MLHNGHAIYHTLSFMHAHTYNNYCSMTLMFTIPVVDNSHESVSRRKPSNIEIIDRFMLIEQN